MREKKVRKDSKVNEEYEDQQKVEQKSADQESEMQDTKEACCHSGEEPHSCACEDSKDDLDGQCKCKGNEDQSDLEKKLSEAEAKQEEYLNMAQRVQADFENYKRRNKNTVSETYQTATLEVIESFLPVLDNLDRALEAAPATEVDESLLKGINLVRRQFLDTLAKLGVEEIEALGKPFDPEYHNAVGQMESEEGQEENTVVVVHQKGYKMGERVIRYSMVHVAR
ncbi:MAG: nucleotide exchange factor GrpE [Clostridiales bacterium]|nr:nucleotide exchange factor GrpE [Clostridiales bacterium]